MQVEGYSLEAQKDKLRKHAEYEGMTVVGEYSDEGFSGKNIKGRLDFQRMLNDIKESKDDISYVLVFKLSRFGRNAADVLSSLQLMQDCGVDLICVEDGIDSSKEAGKLMISVLSAVAEIERENIRAQTMLGRLQKAREGEWNGGFAPYGYQLIDGKLVINEEEAKIIRLIFDKFNHTTMGVNSIATFLNQHGYKKTRRQNNKLETFAGSFIKGVLDNPVYNGKIAYGRRKSEKIAGAHNEYHIVKQDEYMLYNGIHDAIIPDEEWELAQQKRKATGVRNPKTHSLEHEHILSGILKCPVCGNGMYGNVNRKRNKSGDYYKDYFYYACKHRKIVDGHFCDYKKQWGEVVINSAVEEFIRELVNNPKFKDALEKKIDSKIDIDELEKELEELRKTLQQRIGAKKQLGKRMDSLNVTDKFYTEKYQDMDERMNQLYEEIASIQDSIDAVNIRIANVRKQRISTESVYKFLVYFDKLYDKFTDIEKKTFMNSFIERVEIFEEQQENGRILKHIKFRFPVYYDGKMVDEFSWDKESDVECVVLMSR